MHLIRDVKRIFVILRVLKHLLDTVNRQYHNEFIIDENSSHMNISQNTNETKKNFRKTLRKLFNVNMTVIKVV
jgi:hypothetical protein